MKKAISLVLLLTLVLTLCVPAFAADEVMDSVTARMENVEVFVKTETDNPDELLPATVDVTPITQALPGTELAEAEQVVESVLEQIENAFADIEKALAANLAAATNINDKAAAEAAAEAQKAAVVAVIAEIIPDFTAETELVGLCDISIDEATKEVLNNSNGEKFVEVTLALGFSPAMNGKLKCYRFDPLTGKFVVVPCSIDADGNVVLELNHCSTFIFTAEADDIKMNSVESPDTLEQSSMVSVMTVVAVVALLGSAVTMAVSKKHA